MPIAANASHGIKSSRCIALRVMYKIALVPIDSFGRKSSSDSGWLTSSQHFSMISPKYIKVQSRSTSNTQSPSFLSFIIILCQRFLKFDIASQYFLGVPLSLQYFSPALFQSCFSTTCCASTSHEFHTSQFLPSYSTCQNTTPKKIFLTSLEKSSWSLEVSLPLFDSTFIYSRLG